MFKFIVDTQLPPKLARFLRVKGFDTIHTTYFPNGHLLQDDEIILIAVNEKRIVVTKDSDFRDYFLLKGEPPKILLIQLGNIGNRNLIELFDENIEAIIDFFESGHGMVVFGRTNIIAY